MSHQSEDRRATRKEYQIRKQRGDGRDRSTNASSRRIGNSTNMQADWRRVRRTDRGEQKVQLAEANNEATSELFAHKDRNNACNCPEKKGKTAKSQCPTHSGIQRDAGLPGRANGTCSSYNVSHPFSDTVARIPAVLVFAFPFDPLLGFALTLRPQL